MLQWAPVIDKREERLSTVFSAIILTVLVNKQTLYVSLTGVPVIVLGAGLDVNVFRGGTGEVKLK